MKFKISIYRFTLNCLLLLTLANCQPNTTKSDSYNEMESAIQLSKDYSTVNGLKMYYETYGQGKPLVLIHGGGSTIQSNFGNVIPLLSKNRKVIAMELQAHGRTVDRDDDLSFEQDADDIASLLKNLNIDKADFFGFSNGGTTAMQIAIRHPEMVDKIILGSALAKRSGVPEWFWEFMEQATLDKMPEQLKTAYKQVAPDASGLQTMHDRDAKRMINFKDISDDQIKSIQAPTLIIIGDKDIITPEHAIELSRQIPNARLAIIPGGHGEYIGEITTLSDAFITAELAVLPLIKSFLDKEEK
ncbi:MAG: alpha/beta hydrolase [Cyclobacteriaceae bacterium]